MPNARPTRVWLSLLGQGFCVQREHRQNQEHAQHAQPKMPAREYAARRSVRVRMWGSASERDMTVTRIEKEDPYGVAGGLGQARHISRFRRTT